MYIFINICRQTGDGPKPWNIGGEKLTLIVRLNYEQRCKSVSYIVFLNMLFMQDNEIEF